MATESIRNVKLLCSFGGRILPRPSDSKLRYAGGETHIITIRRSATISDFFAKILQIFDGTIVAVKYQLPDEDLDTLISISCQEDFDNMLDEFDSISDVSVDGSAKIRIFLFDDSESDVLGFSSEMIDNGQVYCKAINDGSIKAKKGSSFSNASSDIQNDASSAKSELGFCVDENLGKVGNSGSKGIVSAVSGELYNNFGTKLECIDMNSHNNGAGDSNIVHDISSRINNVICHQPLNLLTQLHPAQILPCDAFYVPTQRCSQQQAVILDNCSMFEKPLLHAYGGRLKNEQLNVNVSGHGNNRDGSLFHDQGSMLMSYQFVDPRIVQASVRPNIVNERLAINSNVQSLDLIQEFHTPVVGNTAIVQVQEFHGDFKNGNIAKREPWVLMNGSKPQPQVQLSTGTLETIECAQTLHASNDINATRPLAEDRVNGGNMETLEYPPALHAPITRVDSESVETFNLPQTLHVPIAVDTSRQQTSFDLSHALHPPTTGTHSQIQINKGTTVALEHLQSLQVPSAMNTSRPQAPVQVNNANVETQKYVQASQAPVIVNSNVETLEKSQEWHVPHVGNTIKAPNQEFHFQSNCQNMPKSEPPFVNAGNLERIEHDRTLHASNVVNVTMPLANVQVNNGTVVTLEQPQVFHAQAARNMMSRTQDQIQINNGTQETKERSQTPHVPSAMNTSTLHGHVNTSNGSVETNSQVLPSKPSPLPTVDTVRSQATIQVNSRIREPLELHAPVAMNANRPQAQIQPNIGTLELLDHVQASQVPIALNVTRPQTPIKVNSRIENKEHSQALRAPESMNTSRLQAHAQTQINIDAVAKNESKIEEVQTGIPCGTCGHTREITHMREKESWPQMNVSSTKESAGETNAGNMAAKTQFATFTDGSAPEMAQSEDDGLLKNPSATTMVHCHFPDPFQTLSQNMDASLDHMLNQGVATKLVNDGSFLVTESPSRVSVPEFSSAYVRPANVTKTSNNTTETRNVTELLAAISLANSKVVPILKPDDFISVRENSHGTSQARPISHLLPYPLDSKLEYTTTDLDGNQVLISQAGGSSLHVGNGNSYIVSDGIPCRQIKHMQPPEDFEPLNPLPTSDTNHGSTMMNNRGSLISFSENMSTQPEVTYASSFAPDYLTSNATPVQVSATVPIQYTNAIHIPLVDNNPIQYVSSNSTNGHSVHPNELAPPLFCNLGPQKNPSDIHLVPPVPITMSSTELVPPLDLCADHVTSEKGIDAVPMFVEEGGDQHVHNSTIPVQFIQGEGKDVHALTKHVMATALEPSRPLSFTDVPNDMNVLDLSFNKENVLCDANSPTQKAMVEVGDQKFEGTSKQVDMTKVGFLPTNDMNVLDLSFNKENVLCDANSPTQKAMVEVGDQKFEGTSKQVDMTKVGFLPTNDLGRLQIIKNDDLEELKELGSGSYGTVYHGKWKGSDVAIKRINERCFAGKPSEEERMKSDFWNEACNLAGLHHPNIVAFYGVVLDGPNGSFATVTEFMVNGSLRRALLKNEKILDIRKRLLIAMDVAFGMEYLHSKNMIHFDLKSDNLLVNLRDPQRPICKIADLGLSKVKRQTLISGGMRGTLPWMAPELLNGNSSLVSNKVDVFSFGIVMWELITGQEPYHDLHQGTIIGGIVSNTLRPPAPESCDPDWRSLMEQCWSQEPSDRPTFVEIASRLRSMAASLPQK